MKEYSFEEVIANIKEGETYKCTSNIYIIKTIHRNEIGLKINNYEPLERCGTNDIQRFIKVETPVSFIEAWESYLHGKVIKSLETKNRYLRAYSHIMVNINSQGRWLNDAVGIGYKEMEGLWLIQEESEVDDK